MPTPNGGSLLDQLVRACFGLLLAAVAVVVAVRLIESVWLPLLLILGVAGGIGIGVALLLRRRQGW